MSTRRGPAWLADLQARFGDVLRTPLERDGAALRARTEAYADEAVADVVELAHAPARTRLAVYNRQYWLRLVGALRTAFPRTARVLGPSAFHELAVRFLVEQPPHAWDLERVPDGLERVASGALAAEAASIDAAFRGVLRASAAAPFRPSAEDAARLEAARLVPSPAVALVVEHWPLVDVDALVDGEPPAPLGVRRAWALVREAAGVRRISLEPHEHALFTLLAEHAVGDALAQLEASCAPEERAALPERARRWLARGAALGLWSGVAPISEAGRRS